MDILHTKEVVSSIADDQTFFANNLNYSNSKRLKTVKT